VDLLPEINVAPSYQPEASSLLPDAFRAEVDAYLGSRQPPSFLANLKQRVVLPQHENILTGTKYNVPLLNALVFYVGIRVGPSLVEPHHKHPCLR
jgi:CCR4-NOT transcription complex subunit 1